MVIVLQELRNVFHSHCLCCKLALMLSMQVLDVYVISMWEFQMRYTQKATVWPVGLVGYLRYERPIVKKGKVSFGVKNICCMHSRICTNLALKNVIHAFILKFLKQYIDMVVRFHLFYFNIF